MELKNKLHIISAQPMDRYYCWQLRVQLYNFRLHGVSGLYTPLLFMAHGINEISDEFKELENDYPEVKFFYYKDGENITHKFMGGFNYIPLLRPYILRKHFETFPELTKLSFLYLDSDVLFIKPLDLAQFLNDDIVYCSNTRGYNAASYFDSKIKDVKPNRLELYKKIDVLDGAAKLIGISREICVKNEENTGGAQYILKGIDSQFWADVFDGCLFLLLYLRNINSKYFESEDKGFQVWAADMWSVLWNLWKRGIETRTPKELDFAWPYTPIETLNDYHLYHDAGKGDGIFNKRKIEYVLKTSTPYEDDLSYVDRKFSSYFYVQQLLKSKKS